MLEGVLKAGTTLQSVSVYGVSILGMLEGVLKAGTISPARRGGTPVSILGMLEGVLKVSSAPHPYPPKAVSILGMLEGVLKAWVKPWQT